MLSESCVNICRYSLQLRLHASQIQSGCLSRFKVATFFDKSQCVESQIVMKFELKKGVELCRKTL